MAVSSRWPGMHRQHSLSSAAKGISAKHSPKYSYPLKYFHLWWIKMENGSKLRRVHIKDLKPVYNLVPFVTNVKK